MSSELADPLFQRLLQSFPVNQAYSPADWDEDEMPGPVRHYLEQLLRHHSRREARRLRRARTDWVDYDHPEMEKAVRSFFSTVEAHMQVPADQWTDLLRQAARQTTAHLVRPVPTLLDFVFDEGTEPLPLPRIRRRMQFFGPYAYLRDAVHAFAEKRSLDALTPDQCERVLRRVDERMTADFDAPRWLDLLDPLFEVARHATERKQIPVRILQSFFEEKEASGVVRRLSSARQEDGTDTLGPEALRQLLEDVVTTAAPATATRSEPSPPAPSVEASEDEDIQRVAESARPTNRGASTVDEDSAATPLWQQFQRGQERQESNAAADSGRSQDPLWARFRHHQPSRAAASERARSAEANRSTSTPTPTPAGTQDNESDLSSLERNVLGGEGSSQRSVYVSELFNGDKEAYREVLERLRTTESWSEASQIIASDVFRTYEVNIYSDAAVHFTDAVEAGFRK